VEEIEGDPETVAGARQALEEGISTLLDEMRLSLDYYGAQESALPVGKIVFSGPGSTIPGFALRMEEGLGTPIEVARPAALSALDDEAAARLTLSYGLALES
jgi:Tfp pilus assembly PilM family ATPase